MPTRLLRYAAADWPTPDCHPECAYWEAVTRWRDEHADDDASPLEVVDGPDVPWHEEWI